MCRGGRVLALPSLCFCSCLEGELPCPRRPAWVRLAPGYLKDFVGAVPTVCAPWVLCMDFLGRCPLPQPCLRAMLIQILMEDATWLWAESEGVPARAHPRDLHCFGGVPAWAGRLTVPSDPVSAGRGNLPALGGDRSCPSRAPAD